MATNYLKSYGNYDYRTASNGKEAIQLVLDEKDMGNKFDVILMDCNMPILDGYEASREIKAMIKDGIIRPLKIIAVTANVSNTDQERCLKNGMDYFLTKPVEKEILRDLLLDVIGKKN